MDKSITTIKSKCDFCVVFLFQLLFSNLMKYIASNLNTLQMKSTYSFSLAVVLSPGKKAYGLSFFFSEVL